MQLSLRCAFFIFCLVAATAHAKEAPTTNSSVRALGMGDAFTALADDESSLFYNPAGLARVRGLNWKVFGVGAAASGLTAYKKIQDLNTSSGGSGFAAQVNSLMGEHVFAGAGGESIFTMPMIGFGVYNHGGATIRVNNPVYPQLHTRVVNDFGYVLGLGVPAGFFHFGMALKYIKRTGTDQTFGPAFIADLDPNSITGQLTPWGVGYGADLGTSFVIPAPFFNAAISAVWKNIGKIEFRSANNSPIPDEDNNLTLGAALDFDLPLLSIRPAVDIVYLNNAEMQMMRKINMGIEIGIPMLDLRGGFHEGYYTAGVGVNLGLFRVDAATYGVELGDYPGQIEDRRYVAQFTMQVGLGNFGVSGGDKKKGSGGKDGGSNSNNSIWGGKRLKQRR